MDLERYTRRARVAPVPKPPAQSPRSDRPVLQTAGTAVSAKRDSSETAGSNVSGGAVVRRIVLSGTNAVREETNKTRCMQGITMTAALH